MADRRSWICKLCSVSKPDRANLWIHMKSKHAIHASVNPMPCLYSDCIFTFRSLSSLTCHMSRKHPENDNSDIYCELYLKCAHCGVFCFTVKSYLIHLRVHARRNESVACPVKHCTFSTNIVGTYGSHMSKKHGLLTLEHIKDTLKVPRRTWKQHKSCTVVPSIDSDVETTDTDVNTADVENSCFNNSAECAAETSVAEMANEVALLYLKMKCVHGISAYAIQNIFEDLNRLTELSKYTIQQQIISTLEKNDCCTSISAEVCEAVLNEFPLKKLADKGCLLSSPWKMEKYIRSHFTVIEPQILKLGYMGEKACTYAYVPVLDALRNILKNANVLKFVLETRKPVQEKYVNYQSGNHFKENVLFAEEEFSLQIAFYFDEFEIANPLGTSKGVYKLSAFYWTIANMPLHVKASVNNIQLAVLCRSKFVQHFGLDKVLGQFLQHMSDLECSGVYVDSLGANIRGTISCVCADNLAAHMLFGMSQSFGPSVVRFCRFCLATNKSALQNANTRSCKFPIRTPSNYSYHLQQVDEGIADVSTYGIRHDSIFHKFLSHFHATTGFPPDVSHDLLEGIVPFEVALCIGHFIEKRYFKDVQEINSILHQFHYMYTDAVNKPQSIPCNAVRRSSVGGNATENRTLVRLFPIIFGNYVPSNDLCWELMLLLKDIVEIAFAPALHESDLSYFQSKIDCHISLFSDVFPEVSLKPKHHFVGHYAELTKQYGPLSHFSTMRFESKHAFFKQVVRHCKNFKNIPKMLAARHQLLQCYLTASGILFSHGLSSVSKGDYVSSSHFRHFQTLLQTRFPHLSMFTRLQHATLNGTEYARGLYVIDGFCCGLPQFCKIECVVGCGEDLLLLCVHQSCHYTEHFRSYIVEDTSEYHLHSVNEITDYYPLPGYVINSRNSKVIESRSAAVHAWQTLVTMKHYVSWKLQS